MIRDSQTTKAPGQAYIEGADGLLRHSGARIQLNSGKVLFTRKNSAIYIYIYTYNNNAKKQKVYVNMKCETNTSLKLSLYFVEAINSWS